MCGIEVIIYEPRGIPCIADARGETFDEIVEMCTA
jgi:hypothetical protein